MRQSASGGLTLDTGALLALDRRSKTLAIRGLVDENRKAGAAFCVPITVVAQAWRSPRQANLARLLKAEDVEIARMDVAVARAVGALCAATGHDDVVDVHVALCARQRRHAVVTSDPDDFAGIDPSLPVISI